MKTLKLLLPGYNGEYKKRLGDKKDGCATFYNRNKLSMDKCVHVSYEKKDTVMDRDNVGLITKLSTIPSGTSANTASQSVCVANTHILYNPRRGDIKLGQVMILLAEIDKVALSSSQSYIPTVLCGDFNSEPYSDIYNLLLTGNIRYDNLNIGGMSGQYDGRRGSTNYLQRDFFPKAFKISQACQYIDVALERQGISSDEKNLPNNFETIQNSGKLFHNLNFVSVYDHYLQRNHAPEVTTSHDRGSCNVDYMFYNVLRRRFHRRGHRNIVSERDTVEGNLNLLAKLELLSAKTLDTHGSLPNKHYPSDHIPLLAKFLLS